MSTRCLDKAMELASLQLQHGQITAPADLLHHLRALHALIVELSKAEAETFGASAQSIPVSGPPAPQPETASGETKAPWQAAFTESGVRCLECDEVLGFINENHVRGHGMNMVQYRKKHEVPDEIVLRAGAYLPEV